MGCIVPCLLRLCFVFYVLFFFCFVFRVLCLAFCVAVVVVVVVVVVVRALRLPWNFVDVQVEMCG